MHRRLWPGWCLVAVVLLWAWPLTAVAGDNGDDVDGASEEVEEEVTTGDDADAASEEGVDEAEEGADEDEAEEGAEEDVAEEGADEDVVEEGAEEDIAEEGADEDEAEEGAEEDVAEEGVDEDVEGVAEEAAPDGETVIGPGGRELDTSYPGTEESLAARMDTADLEGLEDLPEGADPAEVYDLRVRELETQIDDLKERVFRSKSRIALLRETVLAENLAGSRAIVTFKDDLGRRYKIDRAIFSIDGSQVYSEVEPTIDDEGVEIFSGPMTPGTHTLSVTLGLQGSGYGVFSYAEGYEFDLRFSCQFTAEEGRTTQVTVRSKKSGNAFTAHEERPSGICEVSMVELAVEDFEEDLEEELEGDIDFGDDIDIDETTPESD